MTQRKEQARAEVPQNTGHLSGVSDQHLMPGLKERLVNVFDAPAKHKTITTRGVARKTGVPEPFVVTAKLRHLQEQVDAIRHKLEMEILPMPARSETSVRQFRLMGRTA